MRGPDSFRNDSCSFPRCEELSVPCFAFSLIRSCSAPPSDGRSWLIIERLKTITALAIHAGLSKISNGIESSAQTIGITAPRNSVAYLPGTRRQPGGLDNMATPIRIGAVSYLTQSLFITGFASLHPMFGCRWMCRAGSPSSSRTASWMSP